MSRRRRRGYRGPTRRPRKQPQPPEPTIRDRSPVPVSERRAARMREQNAAMLQIIDATQKRLERQGRRDWLREQVTKDDPMVGSSVVWGVTEPDSGARVWDPFTRR